LDSQTRKQGRFTQSQSYPVACYDTPEVDADDLLLGGDTQAAILFENALQLALKLLSPLAYLLANNNSN
jgi:hypothetical protein